MSATRPRRRLPAIQRGGFELLGGMVLLMWLLELVNTIDSNRLDGDGIYPRNVSHLWGILTAPFLHVSFQHLIANTIPFAFMGLIVALRGAGRLAAVTAIVILVGGIGTWLVSPSHTSTGQPIVTLGASGVVFGYATYLLARGLFDRSVLELLTGAVVGVIWGGALLASLVPQAHVSWQGHVCGGIGGIVAAYVLRREHAGRSSKGTTRAGAVSGALPQ